MDEYMKKVEAYRAAMSIAKSMLAEVLFRSRNMRKLTA